MQALQDECRIVQPLQDYGVRTGPEDDSKRCEDAGFSLESPQG